MFENDSKKSSFNYVTKQYEIRISHFWLSINKTIQRSLCANLYNEFKSTSKRWNMENAFVLNRNKDDELRNYIRRFDCWKHEKYERSGHKFIDDSFKEHEYDRKCANEYSSIDDDCLLYEHETGRENRIERILDLVIDEGNELGRFTKKEEWVSLHTNLQFTASHNPDGQIQFNGNECPLIFRILSAFTGVTVFLVVVYIFHGYICRVFLPFGSGENIEYNLTYLFRDAILYILWFFTRNG